jgi:hypothetical protein
MASYGEDTTFELMDAAGGEAPNRRKLDLDAREEALNRAETEFQQEQENSFGTTSLSDVLALNVGGMPCTVSRRTLCLIEGSMLASQFSGRWDESLAKDSDNRFFLDQDYQLFERLLTYLRALGNETPGGPIVVPPVFSDDKEQRLFIGLVEFYGCTAGVYRTEIAQRFSSVGDHDKRAEIWQYPARMIETSPDFESHFVLRKKGLFRQLIKAFEVECIQIKKCTRIGWAEDDDIYGHFFFGIDSADGDILNGKNSITLHDGKEIKANIKAGSVVRCEVDDLFWKLFVDGIMIGYKQAHSPEDTRMASRVVPTIYGIGKFRVASVEFESQIEGSVMNVCSSMLGFRDRGF